MQKPLLRYVFPFSPNRVNSLAWTSYYVSIICDECIYLLNLDAIHEAAPTYISVPKSSTAALLDGFESVNIWELAENVISAFSLSIPILMGGKVPQHYAALSSNTKHLNIYKETTVGEWILQHDALELLSEKLPKTLSCDCFAIHCMLWQEINEESLLLLAGSKGGKLFVFLVSEDSCSLLNWFDLSESHWITAIEVSPFTGDEDSEKFMTDSDSSHKQASNGSFAAYIGTSEGEITKHNMIFRGGVLACCPEDNICKSDGISINNILYSPDYTSLAFSKGCNLYIYSNDGQLRRQRISSQLLSGFAWTTSQQITTVALEGEIKLWNVSDFTVEHSVPIFEPNWGLFGISSSCSALYAASLAKTPIPKKSMFYTLTSSSVFEIRVLATDNLDSIFDKLSWGQLESYWDIIHFFFQEHNIDLLDPLMKRILDEWNSFSDQQNNFCSQIDHPTFCRLQFGNCLSKQRKIRGIDADPTIVYQFETEALLPHIIQCITKFLNGTTKEQEKSIRDELQGNSLRLMGSWFYNQIKEEKDNACKHMSVLTELQERLQVSFEENFEICEFCDELVEFTSHNYATCSKNHGVDRCAMSLLMIEQSGNYFCYSCRRFAFALVTSFWWLPDGPWKCPYCRHPFRQYVEC